MSVEHTATFTFQHNPAIHRPEAAHIGDVTLTLLGARPRHEGQLARLRQIAPHITVSGAQLPGVDPLLDQCACYAVDRQAQGASCLNGEPVFRDVLYLFNVIIALEWNTGRAFLQQLRLAAARASDFLYDATNGYMAIGHVIIGGPDLMDVADIQVMASNRIHPRSWMAALNEERKFKPIRVGRGIWQKNQSSLLSWDSPEGYRGLVHEWGHYAFGLPDEYLRPVGVVRAAGGSRFWTRPTQPIEGWATNALDLAAPNVALAVESLMASTQISEYADLDRTFAYIQKYYPLASDPRPLAGPDELPLALPHFPELGPRPLPFAAAAFAGAAINPAAPAEMTLPIQPAIDGARATAGVATGAAEAHWIYLLKGAADDGLPAQMIAQGKIGDRDRLAGGFQLLGAGPGDQVVLVSQVGAAVVVQRAVLAAVSAQGGGSPTLTTDGWADVTPPGMQAGGSLFVDVIPAALDALPGGSYPMHADLSVRVEAPAPPSAARIYPSGAAPSSPVCWAAASPCSVPVAVPHLDGHILIHWAADGSAHEGVFICSYSQGGGPRTSSGGLLPITGGSADGNAMIFFNQNIERLPLAPPAEAPIPLRLVTTTITVGQQILASGAEARSYIFSLASNAALGEYKAALVLYYDSGAPGQGRDLLIYRWDGTAWRQLTTFARPDLPYVAVPIGVLDNGQSLETAPALTDAGSSIRVERYQIFLTPSG